MAHTISARAALRLLPSSEFLPQRVSLLYRLSGKDAPAILLTCLVVALGLWGNVGDELLTAWLIWIVLASLARIALSRAFPLRPLAGDAALRWEGYFCVVSAAVGVAWGVTVLLLYPESARLHEMLLPLVIGCVAMGLPATLAPSPKAFVCFIAPILAPMIGLLFSQGGALNTSAGILILVFSAVLLALYLSSHYALLETLRFGRENEVLLQRLTGAKERLDLALQASNVLIWEWEEPSGAVIFDGRWDDITARPESVGPVELNALVHPEDAGRLSQAQSDCAQGVNLRYAVEHRVRTRSGEWKWCLSRGRVVERDAEGRALRMTGVSVDIDRQKRAEAELMSAVQREKELSELKSKFLSMASHEFRTPLATILSSAELLEHYAESIDAEEKARLLHGVQASAMRMNELINDVLTLGKSESGVLKLNPARLDLRELCARVVSEFRMAQGNAHVVRFDDRFDLSQVEMDQRLLRHIIENLLSNAAKYSPAGTEITLTLSRRGDRALIEVQDRGIGIPQEDQARLFQAFHRASNVDNRPGTGLGLAIVRRSADLHGGAVTFQSKPGAGTRFCVQIPVDAGAVAEHA
jgi:signal transduction histidine kinase